MNKNNTNECIPNPAADPWITCRSKSHHRRIYYYNTITGEAIWNLTDFENDKCKKITDNRVCVGGQDHSDGYPEPEDPPQDICRNNFTSGANEQNIHNTESRSTIFNECIINEPFMEDTLSSSPIDQKWNNINTSNDFMFSVPVATSPQTSIPNNSFSINQPQIKVNIDLDHVEFKNNYVHTTTVPLSERFQRINHVNSHSWFIMPEQGYKSTVTEVSATNTSMKDELEPLSSTHQQSFVASDLRQILSLKRQTNILNNIEQQINTNRPELNSNSIGSLDIGNFGVHQKERINQKQFKNTVVGTTEEDNMNNFQDYIYLVPDAIVFQNHICFLKFLLQFSKTFHFIVLENVLKDIQVNRRSDNDYKKRQARQAMTFITCNIRTGLVSIVQNSIYQNNTRHFYVLDCCLKLVEEHDKIILLSNYEHLKVQKNTDRILIFTVNEFKLIVNTLGDANLIRNHLYPNETSQDVSMQDVSNDQEHDVKDNELIKKQLQTLTSDIPTKVSIGIGTSNPIEEKNTVDASVQTDLDSELLTRILNTESVKTILADSVKLKEMLNNDNKSVSNNWNANLNSPKSHAKDIDNKAKEKKFKWRRKRSSIFFNKKDGTQNSFANLMVQIPEETVKQLNNECNVSANVILPPTEDSSSSGIVSIAPYPNNYWNENNNTRNVLHTSVGKESKKDTNNVMFEVTSETMNENLKSHSDEWVSRFIQIMEEALTQVLEKNPSQSPNVLAPPWTLFEATTCIKMKYHKDRDIVDAGNKLTNTLTKISDEKGTVNIHPTPKQYMEMYSYGVYLIDALQAAYEGCEDLQTASESLSKLLNDIQNPNLSTSQNDSFIDVQEENIENTCNEANRDSKEKAFQTSNEHTLIAKKIQIQLSPVSSPSKCKVRSIFKNEDNKVEEKENININEESESKTLLLSPLDSNSYICVKESVRSFVDEESHTPTYDPPTSHENNTDSSINEIPTSKDSKQPKIIINFTQCADYEKKLKMKELELNDIDSEESYLDYSNDYLDYENQYENIKEWPNDKHFGFENIFNNLLLEIRQTFIIVFAFCMTCQKDVNISEPRRKLLDAKEVYLKISNICNVLNRIIKRDDKLFVSYIAEVLQAEDLMEDFKFDESDLTKYKKIITKYSEQANSLRECLETIIKTYELVY